MADFCTHERIPTKRMRQSLDWYVVLYQLAAQRTNNAIEPDSTDRRELHTAYQDCCLLISATAKTLRRMRGVPDALDETGLRDFLHDTVLPGACVLWAGIMVALDHRGDDCEVDLKTLARRVHPSPQRLITFVERRTDLPSRVHYNLACYYSSIGRLDTAESHLREAIESVFGTTQAYLTSKARQDPSLRELMAAGFDFAPAATPPKR